MFMNQWHGGKWEVHESKTWQCCISSCPKTKIMSHPGAAFNQAGSPKLVAASKVYGTAAASLT